MGKLSEKDRGIVRLSKGLDVLISIIVPVYNAEKYIEKCVGSLIKQTYEKIEIILMVTKRIRIKYAKKCSQETAG